MLRNASTAEPKHIVSIRKDGLGGRLWSLLCTMLDAENQGCDFKFTWMSTKLMAPTEFHSLPTAEELFSKQFLEEHYLESMKDIGDHKTTEGNFTREFLAEYNGSKNLKKYFDRIEFRPPYNNAVRMAEAAELPENSVAIHVRSGDIIFGKVREDARFTEKTIPMPVAKHIVRQFITQGRSVIIFCQDEYSLSMLIEEGAIPVAAFAPVELGDAEERDLFEIILMSRCSEVLAGDSVFAMTACLIGKARLRNPADNLTGDEIVAIVEDYCTGEDNVDNLVASHALKYIYYNFNGDLDPEQKISLIERMANYDPDNRLYSLILAYEFAKNGKLEYADNVLKHRLSAEYEEHKRLPCKSMKHLANPIGHPSRLEEVCRTLFDCSGMGFGYIDLFSAYVSYKDGDTRNSVSTIMKSFFAIDNKMLPIKLFFKCLRQKNNSNYTGSD